MTSDSYLYLFWSVREGQRAFPIRRRVALLAGAQSLQVVGLHPERLPSVGTATPGPGERRQSSYDWLQPIEMGTFYSPPRATRHTPA